MVSANQLVRLEAMQTVDALEKIGAAMTRGWEGMPATPDIARQINNLVAAFDHCEFQRDEARKFGEEAAAKYNELLANVNRVYCAFCGQEYPMGTSKHGNDLLVEHIKVCAKHPMRKLEAEIERLRVIARAHGTL